MVLLLNEVTRQLQNRGYMALVINVTDEENTRTAMALAYQLQVDGILFMATVLTPELIAIATEIHRVPLVQIGRNTDHPEIQVVNIDGRLAGKQLAELLLAQGHRTFGYMKGPDTASHHLMRMEGYEAALEQAGCRLDTLLVAGQYLRTRGYAAMSDYLDATPAGERVDALFCENDILAIGALQALRERDLTMGIVGFDNIDEAAAPASSAGLKVAGNILRYAVSKTPVPFVVADYRDHEILAAQTAVLLKLSLQSGIKKLLLRFAARAGINPHHHYVPASRQPQPGILNNHMVSFVFVNNLVAVTLWYLERLHNGAMCRIQQGFDLVFAASFNDIKR